MTNEETHVHLQETSERNNRKHMKLETLMEKRSLTKPLVVIGLKSCLLRESSLVAGRGTRNLSVLVVRDQCQRFAIIVLRKIANHYEFGGVYF